MLSFKIIITIIFIFMFLCWFKSIKLTIVQRIGQIYSTPFSETKISPLKQSLTKQKLIFILSKKYIK